jgi:hypothetical protein
MSKVGIKRKQSSEKEKPTKASTEDSKKTAPPADYGVSRGIDFQGVTFVVNFDMPSKNIFRAPFISFTRITLQ